MFCCSSKRLLQFRTEVLDSAFSIHSTTWMIEKNLHRHFTRYCIHILTKEIQIYLDYVLFKRLSGKYCIFKMFSWNLVYSLSLTLPSRKLAFSNEVYSWRQAFEILKTSDNSVNGALIQSGVRSVHVDISVMEKTYSSTAACDVCF